MFKKPASVETKSEKQLSGKDVKTLRKELEQYGDVYLAALAKQMWWRKNRTSSFLFSDEGTAILFSSEGYDGYLPTLHTVWKLDALIPIVHIHAPVSKFICRGADLMFPGVRKPFPTVNKDAIVQIQVEGNPKCVAIGRVTQGHEHWDALTTREGVCVEVYHYFGDALWEKNGAEFPPGFRIGSIESLHNDPDGTCLAPNENELLEPPNEGVARVSGSEECRHDGNEELFGKCFLMALWHIKDKELPMPSNQVYNAMRKLRPVGTSVDVKTTPWKKLLPFLRSQEEAGLCSLSKDGEKLTRIVRKHDAYVEFEPWAQMEESEDLSARCLKVEAVWTVPERLKPIWDKEVITVEECEEGVKQYAAAKDLWCKNNRKRIGPDDLLMQEGTVGVVSEKLLERMKVSHRVSETFGGETKVKIRPGAPPKVQVRTCTRRGHNVTIISGLEKYGVDLNLLCGQLRQKLAASTAVEEKDIMVQGLWNESVSKFLSEQWNVPLEAVDNQVKKALKEKKAKQATNIVKH